MIKHCLNFAVRVEAMKIVLPALSLSYKLSYAVSEVVDVCRLLYYSHALNIFEQHSAHGAPACIESNLVNSDT